MNKSTDSGNSAHSLPSVKGTGRLSQQRQLPKSNTGSVYHTRNSGKSSKSEVSNKCNGDSKVTPRPPNRGSRAQPRTVVTEKRKEQEPAQEAKYCFVH